MKAVILAGGSGTRLWPLSRKNYPKQFLKISGERSLLQQTVGRLDPLVAPSDIIVMTNSDYKFHVLSDMNELLGSSGSWQKPPFHLILEPAARNTAPAIALAALYCRQVLGAGDDEVIVVLPSDHVIRPEERFREYLASAEDAARQGWLVTFGVVPTRPETGYGYIKATSQGSGAFLPVERFVEKPDLTKAGQYLKDGGYYWNAGIFAFTVGGILEEVRRLRPDIQMILEKGFDGAVEAFSSMPDISIDYAVMERAEKVAVIPLDLYWNDIGSFDAMHEIFTPDSGGNVHLGDVISVGEKNSLVIGDKRLIATIGLDSMAVIETDDAILIARRDQTQQVKDIVATLREKNRQEAVEHSTVYRPWGSYTVLEEGPRYKIKRIVVNPGARLSLQQHRHRSEHWVVITGTAKVKVGDREITVPENESVFVPKQTLHRLENPGTGPLEIIEVQNGEYVGEDDIIRVDDQYGREQQK